MQSMRTALATLALLIGGSIAVAQDDKQEVQITGLAGWGGYVTRGDWAPVLIDLDNRGKKDITLVVGVTWAAPFSHQNSANPTLDTIYGRSGPSTLLSVALQAKSRKRISLSLPTPDQLPASVWAFAVDTKTNRTVARGEMMTRPAEPPKRILGVVGQLRPEGLDDSVIVAGLQADELPESWQGYTSLEALLWLDGRATELRSTAQVDALKQWISTGGRLYVARANSLNLAGTPIAELLPVKLGAGREVESLDTHFPEGRALILENTLRKGHIRAEADGVNLVTESPRDAGRITFVAVDPTRPPFLGSPKTADFWTWLLEMGPRRTVPPVDEDRAPGPVGSLALAQQAGRFPDIAAPEIGGLFLLIILYLIVVGPLDYLLLRWLQKLEYTWFTFPAYVLLFTLFILLVGGAFIQRAANQREIVVVDHYPETGFIRRRALSAVLAPADVLYSVENAQPLSSNFIEQQQSFDTGGKISEVVFKPDSPTIAGNWLINRNFTGLAVADQVDSAPSILSYTITGLDTVSVRLTVKNTSTQTIQGSTLLTSRGAFWISEIPPGESTLTGSRTHATPTEFAEKEGLADQHQNKFNRGIPVEGEYSGEGLSEQQLNPIARKALIGSVYPFDGQPDPGHTGFAHSLELRRWVKSGGSVLLTWPAATGAVVKYEPKPGRITAVILERFFQGPPP
jgi:hypothetical protein